MCIIGVIPKNSYISDKSIENCWKSNPDGAGFAYVTPENKIYVYKSLKYNDFRQKLRIHLEKFIKTSPFIIHFRIGTHGKNDLSNCHPHIIDENNVFCHNGILHDFGKHNSHKSDTVLFNENVLQKLNKRFVWRIGRNPQRYIIEKMIGSFNKMAFLNTRREVSILNTKQWVRDNKLWYSNSGFLEKKYLWYDSSSYNENNWYSDHYKYNYQKQNNYKDVWVRNNQNLKEENNFSVSFERNYIGKGVIEIKRI
jgi:predicted glutamine amidotransferase